MRFFNFFKKKINPSECCNRGKEIAIAMIWQGRYKAASNILWNLQNWERLNNGEKSAFSKRIKILENSLKLCK